MPLINSQLSIKIDLMGTIPASKSGLNLLWGSGTQSRALLNLSCTSTSLFNENGNINEMSEPLLNVSMLNKHKTPTVVNANQCLKYCLCPKGILKRA